MGRYDYHTIESWEISYLLSLIFIRYPVIAERKIANLWKQRVLICITNIDQLICITIPTLRPASAVFGIEEPLSIFNILRSSSILILFNMEFPCFSKQPSVSRLSLRVSHSSCSTASFAKMSTHSTHSIHSLTHEPNFRAAIQSINTAVQQAVSTRRYTRATILSLMWDNDVMSLGAITAELTGTFEEVFGFDTESFIYRRRRQ